MTDVKINGKTLTEVQYVNVSLQRHHDGRGEFVGDPPPLHVVIERRCSLRAHAQLDPFENAKKNPKKISLSIKMLNAARSESVIFEMQNAFVAEWRLSSETRKVASEKLVLYASDCKMTAIGDSNKSYDVRMQIPE